MKLETAENTHVAPPPSDSLPLEIGCCVMGEQVCTEEGQVMPKEPLQASQAATASEDRRHLPCVLP